MFADRLAPPDIPSRWYCDRPDCDGEPHDGWHWCEHPITGHPAGDEYWRCRHARSAQHPPEGDWRAWLIMAGRGWGKTRTGAEWLAREARKHPAWWAVVAPTRDDLKATCIEGESGLLAALGIGREDDAYNKSDLIIRLSNGSVIRGLSAERPDRTRGPNLAGAWLDELGAWRYMQSWDYLNPALRRGGARVVVTTTPRPTPLVREFTDRKDGSVILTRGATMDNRANLSERAIADLYHRYEGTRLGRQELYGELLLDVPGALWTLEVIHASRRDQRPDSMLRIVVSVDPAVTAGEDADETGIIVGGLDLDGHGWVLEDLTCRLDPDGVAHRVVDAYHRHHADWIVGEVNNGGDYIGALIHTVDADVPYKAIRATRGKVLRAEPVSAAYAQQRVHHLGVFADLESQMCACTPGVELEHDDRLDAMVYAMTELGLAGAGMTWEEVYRVDEKPQGAAPDGAPTPIEHDPWAEVYK